ncbi:MAG: hypothetical protein Q4G19_08230 [Clostridia bacterium]|nr:hypothetical protein [Clostridia bacterium]
MTTYEEILNRYKKRQRDTVVDTIATGLTYMDEIAVETGLLEETGLLTELTESVTGALPFAVIAVSEGTKVILGKKPTKTGVKDGAYRMAKTGAALGVGAAVAGAAGFWAAIPVTMGVRAMFDRYRSKALTGLRVNGRIDRLKELNSSIREERFIESGEEKQVCDLPRCTESETIISM